MTVKGVAADRLIAAWHGPETAAELAKRFKLKSAQMVRKFFKAAKEAGKLPDGPRPHFADRRGVAAVVGADVQFDRIEIEIPMTAEAEASFDAWCAAAEVEHHAKNVASCDASLAALIAAHPEMNDPKFHHYATAPARFGGNARN